MSEFTGDRVQPEPSVLERLAMRESDGVGDDKVDFESTRVTLRVPEL